MDGSPQMGLFDGLEASGGGRGGPDVDEVGRRDAKGRLKWDPSRRAAMKPEVKDLRFDGRGGGYVPARDNARLAGQMKRVWDAMSDGRWRTLGEIAAVTGDPEASVSAQLRHLRKERFGGHRVEKRARGDAAGGLFEYRVNGEKGGA